MSGRIATDVGGNSPQSLLRQPQLNKLLRIRINDDFVPQLLQFPQALDQVDQIVDRTVRQRRDDPGRSLVQLLGPDEP